MWMKTLHQFNVILLSGAFYLPHIYTNLESPDLPCALNLSVYLVQQRAWITSSSIANCKTMPPFLVPLHIQTASFLHVHLASPIQMDGLITTATL